MSLKFLSALKCGIVFIFFKFKTNKITRGNLLSIACGSRSNQEDITVVCSTHVDAHIRCLYTGQQYGHISPYNYLDKYLFGLVVFLMPFDYFLKKLVFLMPFDYFLKKLATA